MDRHWQVDTGINLYGFMDFVNLSSFCETLMLSLIGTAVLEDLLTSPAFLQWKFIHLWHKGNSSLSRHSEVEIHPL